MPTKAKAQDKEQNHAEEQAKAQLESIKEMVANLTRWTAQNIPDDVVRDVLHLTPKHKIDEQDKEAAAAEMNNTETELRDEIREEAEQTIHEDALSVEVRSDWYTLDQDSDKKPAFYRILLCWGGPACQVVGDLSEHGEPETAKIEYQDWGTRWTEYRLNKEEEETVLTYARCFYYGE
jgi:hypothetical protein